MYCYQKPFKFLILVLEMNSVSLLGFLVLLAHFVFFPNWSASSHVLKKRGYDESGSYSSEEEPVYKRHGHEKGYGDKRHRYPTHYGKGYRPPSYGGFPHGDYPMFAPPPPHYISPPMLFPPFQLPVAGSPTQGDFGPLQVASPVLEGSPPQQAPSLLAESPPLGDAPSIQSAASAPGTSVVNSLAASPQLAPPQQLPSLWVGGRKKRSLNEKAKIQQKLNDGENGPKNKQQQRAETTTPATEETTQKLYPDGRSTGQKEMPKQKVTTEEKEEKEKAKEEEEEEKEEQQMDKKEQQRKRKEKKRIEKEEEEEEEEEESLGKHDQQHSEFTQGGPQFRSTWEDR